MSEKCSPATPAAAYFKYIRSWKKMMPNRMRIQLDGKAMKFLFLIKQKIFEFMVLPFITIIEKDIYLIMIKPQDEIVPNAPHRFVKPNRYFNEFFN